jgi:hypothetical protein
VQRVQETECEVSLRGLQFRGSVKELSDCGVVGGVVI